MERTIASHGTVPRRRAYEGRYPAWVLDLVYERRCPWCCQAMGEEAAERFLHEQCEREGAA